MGIILVKKLFYTFFILLCCANASATTFSGGSMSLKTGTSDGGRVLFNVNQPVANNLQSIHDYQRIMKYNNYRYISFMHNTDDTNSEWEDTLYRFNLDTDRVDALRNWNGTTNEDNHNYRWVDFNSLGHGYSVGASHVNQLEFMQTHSTGEFDGIIHSWTGVGTPPSNSNLGTYARGCVESDGDWHTFWRQGDGVGQKYLASAKWNGSSWTEKTLVDWDYTNDANISSYSRIYFESYCDPNGTDAHFIFNVRDGNNTTTTADSFWYVVYFRYEMDTGNIYNADGTLQTIIDESTADRVATTNRHYINGLDVDPIKGVNIVYFRDSTSGTSWFGKGNIYTAYYDSGWQINQLTNTDSSSVHPSYLRILGTSQHYILHNTDSKKSISKSTDLVNWTTYTTDEMHIPCIFANEQNPDPNKPILCVVGSWGAEQIKLFKIDLP